MATAAHNDVVPLSAADKRLEESLKNMKFACSDYMDNPNNTTNARFSSASGQHEQALQGAGLKKQAGYMRKVDKDFRNAPTLSKKQRIAAVIGKSLVSEK